MMIFLTPFRCDVLLMGCLSLWLFKDALGLPYWVSYAVKGRRRLRCEDVGAILDDLEFHFYDIIFEIAKIIKKIKLALKDKCNDDMFALQQVAQTIMEKRFQERFDAAQQAVLNSWALTEQDFKVVLHHFSKRPEIARRKARIIALYQDAMRGVAPSFSSLNVPPELHSQEALLNILQDIETEKYTLFSEILKNRSLDENPTDELVKATEKAERVVLNKRFREKASPSLFQHAISVLMDTPLFKKRKEEIEDRFSRQVVQLMRISLNRSVLDTAKETCASLQTSSSTVETTVKGLDRLLREDGVKYIVCLIIFNKKHLVSVEALSSFTRAVTHLRSTASQNLLCHTRFVTVVLQNGLINQIPYMVQIPGMWLHSMVAISPVYILFGEKQCQTLSGSLDIVLESLHRSVKDNCASISVNSNGVSMTRRRGRDEEANRNASRGYSSSNINVIEEREVTDTFTQSQYIEKWQTKLTEQLDRNMYNFEDTQ